MKIDNPCSRYHYVYQRRVDRFFVVALVIMTVAATLGFGWMTLAALLANVIVTGLATVVVIVVGSVGLACIAALYNWLWGW